MNMKQYSVTAKIWVRLKAKSSEEAENSAKTIVDDALYHYVNTVKRECITTMSISKAKVVWLKDNQPKDIEAGSEGKKRQ